MCVRFICQAKSRNGETDCNQGQGSGISAVAYMDHGALSTSNRTHTHDTTTLSDTTHVTPALLPQAAVAVAGSCSARQV